MRLTAGEAARVVGGAVEGFADVVLRGAEVDSRLLRPDDLFVALPGERRDGHEFVATALATAAGALVKSDIELGPPPEGRALIRVPDPLEAYWALAREERARRGWTVAAVTGSVGKTTAKDFLTHLVKGQRETGWSTGNRNSTLGLPAQILSQPERLDVFVAEAGMSRPGELDVLGGILRPIGVLLYTRIAPAHTEFFDDLSGIVRAKAELIPHLGADGTLVVNADDPHQDLYPSETSSRVLSYGIGADARIEDLENRGLLGSRFELHLPDGRATVELRLPGVHQAENLLAAAAASHALGLGVAEIASGVEGLQAAPHRGRTFTTDDDVTVVDDSYNASPVAVAKMLELLAVVPGRRVAVLGEMYELGELTDTAHRDAGRLAASACDLLLAVGSGPARLLADAARAAGLESVELVVDADQAVEMLRRRLQPGDVVLVKGSRGVALDRTVAGLVGEEAA
jgi:UDP-N-acetylmuramoyl-tripeptide--D-alanyl-D-alanine ligase